MKREMVGRGKKGELGVSDCPENVADQSERAEQFPEAGQREKESLGPPLDMPG